MPGMEDVTFFGNFKVGFCFIGDALKARRNVQLVKPRLRGYNRFTDRP